MNSTSHSEVFKDYYCNNNGKLYKLFEININNFQYKFDIYWGDPSIVFDQRTLKENLPLAVTIMPHRYNYPNSRIFMHEKLKEKYYAAFEAVVAHEIGHLWLHDIVGFNNPSTISVMKENESEKWADYFSYSFFHNYRNTKCLDEFVTILEKVSDMQIEIYNLNPNRASEFAFTKRIADLKFFAEKICSQTKEGNAFIAHMKNAIEITLNALGDIFA